MLKKNKGLIDVLTSVFAFCFGIFFVRVDFYLGFLGGGGGPKIREQ